MDKEQYLNQSRENGLPARCPILEYCSRHALTIYFYSDFSNLDYDNNYIKALKKKVQFPLTLKKIKLN